VTLRDHPMMSHNGVKIWPPVWRQPKSDGKTVTGEVGVLFYVHYNPPTSGTCYLVIDHEGETYVGTLTIENQAFCMELTTLLRSNLRRPIRYIGDLSLPDTHQF
jgi:hypothetical protein